MLFENFNTTNQTQPHYDAHEIFVVFVKSDDCGIVPDLDYNERCLFVESTESCRNHVKIFDYINFVYCTVATPNDFLHWILMVSLLIFVCFLFSILGSTADVFLCPSLTVIADFLHMSENLAGVTILAFGNGAPDLFTSMTDMDGETTILIAEGYGAALFVIGVIGGIIMVITPFKVYEPSYLRDAIFILFITTYVNYIIMNGKVNIYESCFILVLYLVYIIVVIFDQIVVMKMAADVQKKLDMVQAGTADEQLRKELQELREQGVMEVIGKKSHISINIEDTRSGSFIGETQNSRLFSQFIHSLNPIDKEEWEEAGFIGKFHIIVKTPVVFLLLLTVPVVDYDKSGHGWSKLLNILQIVITPCFVITICQYYDVVILHLPIYVFVVAGAIPLMLLAFVTSRTDSAPFFHLIYAFITMAVSISIIQIVASEVVSILETVGIAAKLTPSFLGSTILAWGNSVGDLFSNVTLARQGHHKMGFAACFGGPLIIMFLGLGTNFMYKAIKSSNGIADIRQGALGPNCNTFLMCIIALPMFAILFAKGQARRMIGIYTVILYVLFLFYTCLGEFELVHTFGTDHNDQRVQMI